MPDPKLYNYPKKELKNILNDPEFYEVAIKSNARKFEENSKGSRLGVNMGE